MTSGLANNAGSHSGDIKLAWEKYTKSGEAAEGASDKRLLLISGLSSPMVAWELGFIERLLKSEAEGSDGAGGYEIVRFDNRDVGRSSRCVELYDLADMAADAVTVLDDVGWSSAKVCGHSMGGMIAQQIAIDSPERVQAMVSLMSTTGAPDVGQATPEASAALTVLAPQDRSAWLDYRLETEKLWASPEHWDPGWVRAKGELLFDYGIDPAGAQRQYSALAGSNRDAALAEVDIPTLVIHGSADTLINPDGGARTAKVIPAARYVEIAGMGHDLHPAFWDRLAELITF